MMKVAFTTKATVLLASRSEPTKLAVLVDALADPVDSRVVANGTVGWIDKDDLVIFVC